MRKLFVRLLERLTKSLKEEDIEIICQPQEISKPIPESEIELFLLAESKKTEKKSNDKGIEKKKKKKLPTDILEFDPRDMMEVMEVPFLALSKNRTKPIVYESKDGKTKIKVSAHRAHYLASIYDWDIILLVSSKMQEIINSSSDIPPKTIIIPRHELLKSLHKHNGKKEEKDIKASLSRLKSTLIETTIRNENGKYDAGFGFLDSWGYTEREDIKEIRITISQWLYDGICKKGSLLKVSQEYFDITSGLKKFLYRTARKHVGNNNYWEFSIEKLYEKSASEQEFKKFKYKLKKAVIDNDIPSYFLEWIEDETRTSVRFTNKRKELKRILSESIDQPSLPFL